jgi:hypothetical protein
LAFDPLVKLPAKELTHRAFEIEFDFIEHLRGMRSSDRRKARSHRGASRSSTRV